MLRVQRLMLQSSQSYRYFLQIFDLRPYQQNAISLDKKS